jgi:hypothetical protein
MATYEGKWRCAFCRAVSRGRDMNCGGCGARRGADVEFFLDEDAAPVIDERLLREADDGPDWLCETCGGSNRCSAQDCQTCGAPLSNSRFREVVEGGVDAFRERGRDSEVAPEALTAARRDDGAAQPYAADGHTARAYAPAQAAGTPEWSSGVKLMAGAAAFVVFIFLALVGGGGGGPAGGAFDSGVDPRYSISRSVELTVERVEWKRSVVVEEYREVIFDDWEGTVPPDARVISQRKEIHHHDRVKVGSHVVQEPYTEQVKVGTRTVTEDYTEREQSGTESYRCGTRNRGNGYFEDVYCTRPKYRTVTKTRSKQVDDYQPVTRTRDKTVDDYEEVPVYRQKIKYAVHRWVPAETVVAQHTDLAPHWPEVKAARQRREGRREERYRVYLRDTQSDKVYEREVGAAEFALFAVGAKCAATVNGFDQIVTFTPPSGNASP